MGRVPGERVQQQSGVLELGAVSCRAATRLSIKGAR